MVSVLWCISEPKRDKLRHKYQLIIKKNIICCTLRRMFTCKTLFAIKQITANSCEWPRHSQGLWLRLRFTFWVQHKYIFSYNLTAQYTHCTLNHNMKKSYHHCPIREILFCRKCWHSGKSNARKSNDQVQMFKWCKYKRRSQNINSHEPQLKYLGEILLGWIWIVLIH